jgi:ABC-type glutathione transport system ATPase component
MPNADARAILEVKDLKVHFPLNRNLLGTPRSWAKAVDGVSFRIDEGETLGLVGESGCGKSTVAQAVLRLVEATGGSIMYDGVDLGSLTAAELRSVRRHAQMIFQDPYSSLDPRMKVGAAIREPLDIHGIARGADANAKVGSGNASPSPGPWPWIPNSWCATSRSRHSTCPSRRRSSTC